jgi:ferredoxin--NADP+ reductase
LPTYKIAIVGAGPAGYFTAQAFQKAQKDDLTFVIDMIERLPTPWGLVRSGVAPDHAKIKTVSKVFEKIAKEPNFRLFANVELDKDVSLKDLQDQYDAVVLSTGAPKGRKLGIPGEELPNSLSAADFVPWYNAHPDYINTKVNLSCETAVVIGAGNVAMDVARMLAINPTKLDLTDVAEHALIKFKQSKIRTVIVCGRRGPEHAAFTTPELRELQKLEDVNVYFDKNQIKDATKRANASGEIEKDIRNNLETMKFNTENYKESTNRKLKLNFLLKPIEIKGNNKVEEVVFIINKIQNGKLVSTNKTFTIKTGLVVTAIGYEVVPFSGITVENGRIKNIAGHVEHNVYTTGWAKRGPTGVIGNNKSDSSDVVDLIIGNLKVPKVSKGIMGLLKSGHKIIDQLGWEKINATEVISGEIVGKPRKKEANINKLLILGTN